jgi:hypothetical protein
MQVQPAEWNIFYINLTLALMVAFLVDFLFTRHVIKNRIEHPVDTSDETQTREFLGFSLGIIPGTIVFIFLHLENLSALDGQSEQSFMIVAFAVLLVIASYSGAKVASRITKRNIQTDFKLAVRAEIE